MSRQECRLDILLQTGKGDDKKKKNSRRRRSRFFRPTGPMKFEGSYLSVLPEVLRLCVPSACLIFGVSSLRLANVYHVVPSQNSPCATHPLHSSQPPPHPPPPKHTPHPSKSDFIERKKAKNMSVSSPVLMSLENVSSVAKRRAEGKYFGCIWSLKKKKADTLNGQNTLFILVYKFGEC